MSFKQGIKSKFSPPFCKKLSLQEYCYSPNLEIVEFCKAKKIPVICFPKGIGKNYKDFNNLVKPNGINIDYDVDPDWARENLKDTVIQGGLDPKILLLSDKEVNIHCFTFIVRYNL